MSGEGSFLQRSRPARPSLTDENGTGKPSPAAARQGGSGVASLPCLHSNNSTEQAGPEAWNKLAGNHRKSARLLELHVRKAVQLCGLENLGFLTLTFADHVTDAKEAQRRMNSLLTHVIRPRYGAAVVVLERTKARRIHFHLLVPVGSDIRTGVDFEAIGRRDYRTAGRKLREEWAFWRKTAPAYRFGRTELLPLKSTECAIARYVSKYISKHIEARCADDKGVRLVRVSGQFKAGTTRFAWNTENFRLWREKVALMCQAAGLPEERLGKAFGRRWMFRHQDIVQAVRIPLYASLELAELDSTPPAFREAAAAERFFLEHGTLRMDAAAAVLAIGFRETEGRQIRYDFQDVSDT